MTEPDLSEPLRRLAETAPSPAPTLADDIVERGRAARRRRLGVLAVAGAAAAATLVVVVPLLGSGDGGQSAEPPVATRSTTETEPPAPTDPSARMQVAAAGVRSLLHDTYPSEDVLWVRDRVCKRWDNYAGDPEGCTALTAPEMAELEGLLSTYAITWVEDDRTPDGSPLDLGGHPPYVEISELEVTTDGGSVFVWALRGGRDCGGLALEVALGPGGPEVVGISGEAVVC